ncbi:MAG: polysaccharide deacetylase family protein, partial [Geopsychrobacter sp.]|nr:polysaccharide deacetylase family protein [Geopsychrobacter sp.]
MLLRFLSVLLLLLLCATPSFAGINVFIYHRFGESRYPSTNISVDVFARQLDYLKREGYQVLPLSRIARIVREGLPVPEKTVGLCIDDAFTSFAAEALPLLQKYGFAATLFVNSDAVGTPGYLGWTELRDVLSKGIEIGNHTASHAYLVEMDSGEDSIQWRQRIRADIERSKKALQAQLGVAPEIFAYTYGEYSPAVIDLIKELGFKAAYAQQSGVIYAGSDLWALPRFPMGGPYATLNGFISKLNMRALRVIESEPADPVIREENTPVLRLKLAEEELVFGQINCIGQGQNSCRVRGGPGTT